MLVCICPMRQLDASIEEQRREIDSMKKNIDAHGDVNTKVGVATTLHRGTRDHIVRIAQLTLGILDNQ